MFDFIKKGNKEKEGKINYKYFGLIDNETNVLLVIGKNNYNINTLKEFVLDTYSLSIPTSNIYEEKFYDSLNLEDLCLLKWDNNLLKFTTNSNNTKRLQAKSSLAYSKHRALEEIISKINNLRYRLKKNVSFQETVYINKKMEAQRFKDKGYPEHEMLEYPYILQYADYAGISLKESADAILLKATISDETFSKSELLRIRYFNAIKNAANEKEVEGAYNNFLLDYNIKI